MVGPFLAGRSALNVVAPPGGSLGERTQRKEIVLCLFALPLTGKFIYPVAETLLHLP